MNNETQMKMWINVATSPQYIQWCCALLERYNSYIKEEADRTGRLPIGFIDNVLSVCREHGWKAQIDFYTEMKNL